MFNYLAQVTGKVNTLKNRPVAATDCELYMVRLLTIDSTDDIMVGVLTLPGLHVEYAAGDIVIVAELEQKRGEGIEEFILGKIEKELVIRRKKQKVQNSFLANLFGAQPAEEDEEIIPAENIEAVIGKANKVFVTEAKIETGSVEANVQLDTKSVYTAQVKHLLETIDAQQKEIIALRKEVDELTKWKTNLVIPTIPANP
ncbi:MAG: hypothetical protein NC218_02365 [Acetobacter sp.]|nr:hypothetical protein [Acetobacter sp.]